ncbi:MFS transporter, partial [Actinosynnema sp. NPDC023926]
TSAEFGIAMGIAVFGSIATAVYRDQVTVPADAPSAEQRLSNTGANDRLPGDRAAACGAAANYTAANRLWYQ